MFSLFRQAPAGPSPRDLVQLVAQGAAVLIDVREPAEYQAGHARGALNVPLATLRMKADPASPECLPAFKSGKTIVVHCASGARSAMAQGTLQKMGHAHVHNAGGLRDWLAAGGTPA